MAIFTGAALGALLVTHTGLVIPLILSGALVLAGTLASVMQPGTANRALP
jgi:predicted MFS family arabinose efflux permease